LSSKIAPGGNIKKNAIKNNCIDKKCRNDVQKFTPTKISGEFRIPGEIPRLYLEETLVPVHSS